MNVFYQLMVRQLALLLPFLAFGMVLEAIARVEATHWSKRVGFNLGCTVLYVSAEAGLGVWVGPQLGALVQRLPGAGVLAFSIGPAPSWSAILATALAWLVLRDLFYYAFHRYQHHAPWLWAIHRLHHSEETVNVTTTSRAHWLESPLRLLTVMLPATYLWNPAPALFVSIWLIDLFVGHLIHADLRLGLGRWNRILPTPQNHRVHHSALSVHRDRNFAQIFPLWDVLFGTHYLPRLDEYPPTGLGEGSEPEAWWQAPLLPVAAWTSISAAPLLVREHFPADVTKPSIPVALK